MNYPDKTNTGLRVWELALLISLCFSLCLGAWAQARQAAVSSGLIRLHVIAASDDPAEQELKLRVRDAVLTELEPKLASADTRDEAQSILRRELESICRAAGSVSEGREIAVQLGEEYYPTRNYEGFSLPAGRYTSLRVTVGKGEGHNWWCVVFPPLCVSAAECEKALDGMDNGTRRLICDGEGRVIRFRIVELWGELTEKLRA